jgi:hypothetical protein
MDVYTSKAVLPDCIRSLKGEYAEYISVLWRVFDPIQCDLCTRVRNTQEVGLFMVCRYQSLPFRDNGSVVIYSMCVIRFIYV